MKKYHFLTGIIVTTSIILCFMAVFVFGIKDMTVAKGEIKDFNGGWTFVRPDGSEAKIEALPYSEPSKAGEVFAIENVIPEEFKGKTMSFLSADKELRVFVDGNVIYEFGKEDRRSFGHTPGSITNFIDLPEECEGRIRIEAVAPYDGYASNFLNITVGDKDVIEFNLFKRNLLNYLFCMIILFSGVMLIIFDVIDVVSKQPSSGASYLGVICFMGAIYHAIETKSMNVFYGNQTLYSIIVFLVIMVMPALLCMYYLLSYEEKYLKRVKVNLWLCYINCFVQICIQVFGIADFMIIAPLSHAMIMITIINLVTITTNKMLLKHKETGKLDSTLMLEGIGVASIMIGSATDIIRFYVSPVGDMGKYGRIGMLIFSVLMLRNHIQSVSERYVNQVEKNMSLMSELLEKAKAENRAKTIFLANMSHEIRTPMNSIMGFAEILLTQKMTSEQEDYVLNIRDSSQSLLSIINDILDISKVESGKMELIEKNFSTKKLLTSALMEISLLADKKELEFRTDISETLPVTLYGDEVRLKEILINILNNAVKYTREGYVSIEAKGEVAEGILNLNVVISDTGIGISKENQEKIFNVFEQVEQLKNKGIEGTGLGLSIVKGYLTLMKGTVEVESEVGQGARFTVKIPLKVVDASPIGKISFERAKKEKTSIGDIKIKDRTALVVDDSRVNLKVIRKVLENYGLKVDEADGGEKSIELCSNKQYDMVFMDQMMPGVDGITAMKKIREIDGYEAGGKNKIFVLTANAIKGVEEELLAEGFDAYFSKPIEFRKIEEMLLNYW